MKLPQHQSFTKAADVLDVSSAAVSRWIKSLEQRLGLLLLHRTTRSVALTDAIEMTRICSTLSIEVRVRFQVVYNTFRRGNERPSRKTKDQRWCWLLGKGFLFIQLLNTGRSLSRWSFLTSSLTINECT